MKTRGQIWRSLLKTWLEDTFTWLIIVILTLLFIGIVFSIGYFVSMIFVKNTTLNIFFGIVGLAILGAIVGICSFISHLKELYDREKNR